MIDIHEERVDLQVHTIYQVPFPKGPCRGIYFDCNENRLVDERSFRNEQIAQ